VRLVTLGNHGLIVEKEVVPLQPLAVALLAYLTLEGPQQRRHIAELFWPNSTNGLNSLSTTLSRIRRVAPAAIVTQGTTVVESAIDSDVVAVSTATGSQIEQIYNGGFLASIDTTGFRHELDEWVYKVRTRTAEQAEAALMAEARRLRKSGNQHEAAGSASAAWAIATRDAFPSPDLLDDYHQAFSIAGHPLSAQVQDQAREFGIELIPVDEPPAAVTEQPTRPSERGFGFEEERELLRHGIANGAVTQIVGLGGSGKTFLARDLLDDAAAGAGLQKTWVDLAPLTDIQAIPAAIASATSVTLHPDADLVDALSDLPPTLLILDNFEHVVDATPLITELAALPDLRIVVTTRIPLEIAGASTVQMNGLSLNQQRPAARELLIAAALRSGLDLRNDDFAQLDEVCALVGGLPLALELAGSWSRILPMSEIATSLRQSIDLLDPSISEKSQRSMRAIVEQSVTSLDEPATLALQQLALFPVGCTVSDATTHLGISAAVMGNLAERSLVSIAPGAPRLRMHPLISKHAADLISPAAEPPLRHAQQAWCLAVVPTMSNNAASPATAHLPEVIGPELANILACWSWAGAHGEWPVIEATIETVREFYVVSGRLSEGQRAFDELLQATKKQPPSTDLTARLTETVAWLALLTGQLQRAKANVADAQRLADSGDVTSDTRAMILRTAGTIELSTGNAKSAAELFERAFDLVSPTTPSTLVAKLHDDMGSCFESLGRVDEARESFRATLALGRELDDPVLIARAYLLLAGLEQVEDPRRCLVLAAEGLAVAQQHDLGHLAMYAPLFAGQAHLTLNNAEAAAASFAEGLAAATDIGHAMSVAAAHVGIAESLLEVDAARCEQELTEGLRGSIETRCIPYVLWACFVGACLTLSVDATSTRATESLALAVHHPATEAAVRSRAIRVMEDLGLDLGHPPDPLLEGSVDEIGERLLELLMFD